MPKGGVRMGLRLETTGWLTASALAGLVAFFLPGYGPCDRAARPGPRSTVSVVRDGHGEGRDLVALTWRTRSGEEAAKVQIPVTGLGKGPGDRIGPVSIVLAAAGGDANSHEFDTREWPWWKGFPRPVGFPDHKYTRLVPAQGGADTGSGGIRAWTRYASDGVETTQEWFFADLAGKDEAAYDCLITVRNQGRQALEEYGQLFASYTKWSAGGQFYWASDGTIAAYPRKSHLDHYVVAKGSSFERLGRVPHCPGGGGVVKATWLHPASISSPNGRGYRHVILVEEAFAAALTRGMGGAARDYVLHPRRGPSSPGGGSGPTSATCSSAPATRTSGGCCGSAGGRSRKAGTASTACRGPCRRGGDVASLDPHQEVPGAAQASRAFDPASDPDQAGHRAGATNGFSRIRLGRSTVARSDVSERDGHTPADHRGLKCRRRS
jgi:hypothetical protein